MFHGHGDQMAPMAQVLLTEPSNGQMIGFGGAAGENHLGGATPRASATVCRP